MKIFKPHDSTEINTSNEIKEEKQFIFFSKKLHFIRDCACEGLAIHIHLMLWGYKDLFTKINYMKSMDEIFEDFNQKLVVITFSLDEKIENKNEIKKINFKTDCLIIELDECIHEIKKQKLEHPELLENLEKLKEKIKNELVASHEKEKEISFLCHSIKQQLIVLKINKLGYLNLVTRLFFSSFLSTSVGLLGFFTIPAISLSYAVANYKKKFKYNE